VELARADPRTARAVNARFAPVLAYLAGRYFVPDRHLGRQTKISWLSRRVSLVACLAGLSAFAVLERHLGRRGGSRRSALLWLGLFALIVSMVDTVSS
jgi:hypothetical protein